MCQYAVCVCVCVWWGGGSGASSFGRSKLRPALLPASLVLRAVLELSAFCLCQGVLIRVFKWNKNLTFSKLAELFDIILRKFQETDLIVHLPKIFKDPKPLKYHMTNTKQIAWTGNTSNKILSNTTALFWLDFWLDCEDVSTMLALNLKTMN